jgi:RNA polymerase sigma-70 factor (ECF subfamily)
MEVAARTMNDQSLDHWIERLNAGDVAAVERLFVAYEPYLRIAVRRRLGRRLRTKIDSGDVVQSVFADVLVGVRDQGWVFEGPDQLLALLRRIAWRRLADRYQKHRKALDCEQPLEALDPKALPDSSRPGPSAEARGHEFWERIVAACPPAHREVVRLRKEGLRLGEIAARTGLHEGSVRRIIYDVARRLAIPPKIGPEPEPEPEPSGPDGSS